MAHGLEVRVKKSQASKVYFPWRVACTVLVIGLLVIFGMSGADRSASADSPTPTPTCYPAGYAHPDGTTEIVCLPAPQEVGPAMVDFSTFEQQVLELVNQARWDNGNLPPLKGNQALTNAARYHSKDMRDDNYVSHDSYNRDSNGNLVFERSVWDRIKSYYDAGPMAENIAAGYLTPGDVVRAMMDSPGHRANILNSDYREIGIGYASGGSWGHYWTQDFAMQDNVYPVVINREAYSTTTPSVSLYVYGSGWATQMRFSNDGVNWSAWEPYNPDKSWTLASASGLETVYCQITDGSTTYTNSDDIYLYGVSVVPTSLLFLQETGTGINVPPTQTVSIENRGVAGLDWNAAAEPWIWLSASSGTAPSTLVVSTTRTSPIGIHTGLITITATVSGVAHSSQTVQVTLFIADDFNHIYLPSTQKGYQQ